jgi:apolipoprotein D and lipocalin family protein
MTRSGLALALLVVASAAVGDERLPVEPVPELDLARYAGTWYEIARLPFRYQKDCAHSVVVHYALRDDGRVDVTNRCVRADGTVSEARGLAKRSGASRPASALKVRFAPAFLSFLSAVWADYWVIDLAPDYGHAAVGGPDRKYLWILSRAPEMPEAQYREVVDRLARVYDVSGLVRTEQRGPLPAAP